jgi:hypothetical protein
MTAFRASEFDCRLDEAREPEPCGSTVCPDPVLGVSSIFRSREISRVFQVQSTPQAWHKNQSGEDGPFHAWGILGGISRLIQAK